MCSRVHRQFHSESRRAVQPRPETRPGHPQVPSVSWSKSRVFPDVQTTCYEVYSSRLLLMLVHTTTDFCLSQICQHSSMPTCVVWHWPIDDNLVIHVPSLMWHNISPSLGFDVLQVKRCKTYTRDTGSVFTLELYSHLKLSLKLIVRITSGVLIIFYISILQ